MALISSGGGMLRTPNLGKAVQAYARTLNHGPGGPRHTPPRMYGAAKAKPMKPLKNPAFGGASAAVKAAGTAVAHAIKPIAPTVPGGSKVAAVTAAITPTTPGAPGAPDPTTDPFAFIKSLMPSTDPASVRALIDQVYAPARQAINDQIAGLQATSAAQAKQMQDVYTAFEQYLTGMPNEIQQIYGQKGAQDGAALMKGPVGDVQNQLGQFSAINSNLMSEEGKNWAAYAAAQPHIYALMATQNIKQMLGVEQANETTLRSKLLDLSSQEASQILNYLQTAQDKDTQLQEWAFQQKQAQTNAGIAQATAAQTQAIKIAEYNLNYAQKQAAIAFNQWKVEQSLGHQQAALQALNAYRQAELKVRQASLADQNARFAVSQANQSQRQQTGIAARQAAAATAAGERKAAAAAKATAATNKATKAGLAKAQTGLNSTIQRMGKDVGSKKGKYGLGTPIWVGPKGQVSSTPVKGWAKQTSKGKQYTPQNLWTYAYSTYATSLFRYYRTLYPGLAKQQGAIQKLVESRIAAAVGWHP